MITLTLPRYQNACRTSRSSLGHVNCHHGFLPHHRQFAGYSYKKASIAAASFKNISPEQKSRFSRPDGWTAPGPQASGPQGHPDLHPQGDEDLSFLTGDWRIFQLKDGHRWSIDDMMTAMVAIQEARNLTAVTPPDHTSSALPSPGHTSPGAPYCSSWVQRHLDIGCGIGSVLLMVAWGLPHVQGLGVEAQQLSAAMAARSVRYNGAADRCEVRNGDLRDALMVPEGGVFDLVTGTPPYLPPGKGIESGRRQKGPCCFETKGGIEDYCLAAARYLAPEGLFVVCSGIQGQPAGRTQHAAVSAQLHVLRQVEVVPKEGKPPLFNVHVMAHAQSHRAIHHPQVVGEVFTVRLQDGSLSPDMRAAREMMGLPPARSKATESG